jgi:hypothetical protein
MRQLCRGPPKTQRSSEVFEVYRNHDVNQREGREYHDQSWRAAQNTSYIISFLGSTYSNGDGESRRGKGDVDKAEEQRNVGVR